MNMPCACGIVRSNYHWINANTATIVLGNYSANDAKWLSAPCVTFIQGKLDNLLENSELISVVVLREDLFENYNYPFMLNVKKEGVRV